MAIAGRVDVLIALQMLVIWFSEHRTDSEIEEEWAVEKNVGDENSCGEYR